MVADDVDTVRELLQRVDIVGQHRGEVKVCSLLGKGTTFTVCLPVEEA